MDFNDDGQDLDFDFTDIENGNDDDDDNSNKMTRDDDPSKQPAKHDENIESLEEDRLERRQALEDERRKALIGWLDATVALNKATIDEIKTLTTFSDVSKDTASRNEPHRTANTTNPNVEEKMLTVKQRRLDFESVVRWVTRDDEEVNISARVYCRSGGLSSSSSASLSLSSPSSSSSVEYGTHPLRVKRSISSGELMDLIIEKILPKLQKKDIMFLTDEGRRIRDETTRLEVYEGAEVTVIAGLEGSENDNEDV